MRTTYTPPTSVSSAWLRRVPFCSLSALMVLPLGRILTLWAWLTRKMKTRDAGWKNQPNWVACVFTKNCFWDSFDACVLTKNLCSDLYVRAQLMSDEWWWWWWPRACVHIILYVQSWISIKLFESFLIHVETPPSMLYLSNIKYAWNILLIGKYSFYKYLFNASGDLVSRCGPFQRKIIITLLIYFIDWYLIWLCRA